MKYVVPLGVILLLPWGEGWDEGMRENQPFEWMLSPHPLAYGECPLPRERGIGPVGGHRVLLTLNHTGAWSSFG